MSLMPSHGGPQRPEETRNLLIALALSTLILLGWQYFYEMPRRQQEAALRQQQAGTQLTETTASAPQQAAPAELSSAQPVTLEEALAQSPRLTIRSPEVTGSLQLTGARLDDLTLRNYRQTVAKDSPPVTLLAPSATQSGYFADLGWRSTDTVVPSASTPWTASSQTLAPGQPVTLSWTNPEGVRFEMEFALDEHFLFTVTQRVINTTGRPLSLAPFGLINRELAHENQHFAILHEGAIGVVDNTLKEVSYKDLREEGEQKFANAQGWLGISDKYWLTALIPDGPAPFTAKFQTYQSHGTQRYQVDYLRPALQVAPGATGEQITRLFAGAKHVDLLDGYGKQYNIPLFDRAVDFGVLYFLTKPIFHLLHFFHTLLGNFGLAILALTCVIRLLMFPLANKSYYSMAQMRKLMPKMNDIRAKYGEDRLRMNQEVMELYKREKINPASGCLPMLLQIPVFFALYKVLFVTIEMRHAPFYGWLQDLSAPDPSNLFTLFGLIPWNTPSFLHIGILPILMTTTMIIQQKLNPKPNDPVQAQVMGLLPYLFLFLFASFPAGLVLYWVWSNMLSILQQFIITRRYEKRTGDTSHRRKPKAA
jgi:YidC/Oxa1 family membrane protein insertase